MYVKVIACLLRHVITQPSIVFKLKTTSSDMPTLSNPFFLMQGVFLNAMGFRLFLKGYIYVQSYVSV